MSASDNSHPPTPEVSFNDAVEFLTKRTPNSCPACGFNSWSVSAPVQNGSAHITAGLVWANESDGNIYMKGTPLVTATCEKCAYVRIHNLKFIAKWVADGKPEFVE